MLCTHKRISAVAARCSLAAALMFGGGLAAQAAAVTYNFTGTITGFSHGPLGAIVVGDVFSGSFTYETGAAALNNNGSTANYNAISHIEAAVHGMTLASNTTPGARDVTVTNSATDTLVLNTFPGSYTQSLANNSGTTFSCFGTTCSPYFQYLLLEDSTGTEFDSMALPTTLGLDAFTSGSFYFNWLTTNTLSQVYAVGSLTSLTLATAVPEPSSIALALVALGGVSVSRRRRG